MADIYDYLKWRGDLSFENAPFNNIDNAILSEMVYVGLAQLSDKKGSVKKEIRKAAREFLKENPVTEPDTIPKIERAAAELMETAAQTERFGHLKLSGYRNIVSTQAAEQMAVITYWLSDDTVYVAFRGTDDTIAGWKEDFMLSCIPETGGQQHAVKYMNEYFSDTRLKIMVGGHSKGGNFAVYASAFADRPVRDQIVRVFSNDGPGFMRNITQRPEYSEVIPKVVSIIHEGSVVGAIMDNKVKPMVVKSSAGGLAQHQILSWEVMGNDFIRAKRRSSSLIFQKGMKDWLSELTKNELEVFTECLFGLVEATGARTLNEISASKWNAVKNIISNAGSMDKERQRDFFRVIGQFIKKNGLAAKEDLLLFSAESRAGRGTTDQNIRRGP